MDGRVWGSSGSNVVTRRMLVAALREVLLCVLGAFCFTPPSGSPSRCPWPLLRSEAGTEKGQGSRQPLLSQG